MERPEKLYHGSRALDVLSDLRPTGYEQTRNGKTGNFVFATHRLDQAILFASPFPGDGSFLTSLDERTNTGSLLLFANETGESYLARPVKGRVYELPTDGFEQVHFGNERVPAREWIAPHNHTVSLPPQKPLAVTSHRQVMEAGVQIFTLHPEAPAGQLSQLNLGTEDRAEKLGSLLAQPNSPLVWQNHEHKLGMDERILSAFRIASRCLLRRRQCTFRPQ